MACSSGVQQLDPMEVGSHGAGSAMPLALRSGLKSVREKFEGEGVETFTYMNDAPFDLNGFTTNTVPRQRGTEINKNVFELPGTTEAQSFFQERCPYNQLIFQPSLM